uniref:Phosphoglycerate mutase n=1 Tax=Ditylenchus dipsaci TaxID=166011 RepID=A0A915D9E4_9BILA
MSSKKRRQVYAIRHAEREDNINPFGSTTRSSASQRTARTIQRFQEGLCILISLLQSSTDGQRHPEGRQDEGFIEPGFLESSAVISEAITGFESVEDTERRFPGLIDASYKPVHADVSQEEEQWGNLGCKKRVFDTMSKILKMCKEGSNILIIGHKSSLAAVHIFFTRDRAIYPGQATVTKTKIPLNAIVQTVASGSGLKDGQTQLNNNIWQRMSHMNVMLLKERLDFSELDHNFCNNPAASGQSATASLNFNQLSNQTNHNL